MDDVEGATAPVAFLGRAPPTVALSTSPVPTDWTRWRVRTVLVLWARPDLEEEDPASFGTAVVAGVVVDLPPGS